MSKRNVSGKEKPSPLLWVAGLVLVVLFGFVAYGTFFGYTQTSATLAIHEAKPALLNDTLRHPTDPAGVMQASFNIAQATGDDVSEIMEAGASVVEASGLQAESYANARATHKGILASNLETLAQARETNARAREIAARARARELENTNAVLGIFEGIAIKILFLVVAAGFLYILYKLAYFAYRFKV